MDPSGGTEKLHRKVECVRNICVLGHVDHGKTTLVDSLLASNGIISKRMAGKLRYLDSRADEQERGITMKSSSISLHFHGRITDKDYLVNLIDSPGHIDFSSEVSTAVRLCDGAVVVVDVIEGVCPQTRACLEQIYLEKLKPVLVLNKIDRLILERQLAPLDAYMHLMQLLEQVNAVIGSVFASDVLAKEDINNRDNYESALESVDDSDLYLSPSSSNVVFCSAYDGWGFSLRDFAKIYAKRLEMSPNSLERFLWGDYYYDAKKKCIAEGAQERAKKPLFVQLVLENIWSLYDTVVLRKDKEKLPIIAEKLGLQLSPRDLRIGDAKSQVKAVLSQWLPIDYAVLDMVVRHIPPPNRISDERAQRLLCPGNISLDTMPSETMALVEDLKCCEANSDRVIVFVSKMTPMHISQLSSNKPKRLTESGQVRREEIRRSIEGHKELSTSAPVESILKCEKHSTTSHAPIQATSQKMEISVTNSEETPVDGTSDEYVFIAFARIFSGTLRPGIKLYSLFPKHDPRNQDLLNSDSPHVRQITIGDIYVFMGSELHAIDEMPAGNVVGIGGLDEHIVKTATLSNTLYCTSFSDLSLMATPILRVAIEPVNPQEMPKLIRGLKLLNQADACVQVSVERTGEHVITTLGELHMEKCVRDLEQNYAKIKVNVSEPIVPFRETILPAATTDMVNEVILKTANDKELSKKIATLQTPNKLSRISVIAISLPQNIIDLLEKYSSSIKTISASSRSFTFSEQHKKLLQHLRKNMAKCLQELDLLAVPINPSYRNNTIERVWSLGPHNCGANILINCSDYNHPNFWSECSMENNIVIESQKLPTDDEVYDIRHDYNSSFVNGFQLCTSAGPLCEEPMQGVGFVVLDWCINVSSNDLNSKFYGPFSGQILNTVKEACRLAFQNQPQRLVSPMYSCNIVVNAEMLGKMYAVVGRRHGRILSSDLTQGSGNFSVQAILPVIESFNFVQEIRKQTSGLACPQLMFSQWEVINLDPFWVPSTEEEIAHFGEKADFANRAKFYMESVRRRKGLHVDEKIIEHAEKQRTLSKNK